MVTLALFQLIISVGFSRNESGRSRVADEFGAPNEANVIFEEMRRSTVSEIILGTYITTVHEVCSAKFARQDQPTRDVTRNDDGFGGHFAQRVSEFQDLANISVIRIPRSKGLHHTHSAHIFLKNESVILIAQYQFDLTSHTSNLKSSDSSTTRGT